MKIKKQHILFSLLCVIVFALACVAVYTYFIKDNPGGNDFYSRWAGARALLVDGKDPYSLEVTAEIQKVKGIPSELVGKGSFAYPLHVVFLFFPLAYLSYAWAMAIWMVMLWGIIIAITFLLLNYLAWQPRPLTLVALLLYALFSYPIFRSVLLGQFTLHVTLFLIAALWCLQCGHDGWAGIFLAATSIKPQMMPLIGVWFVVWAISKRRWGFMKGLLGGGAAMFLAALLLFPRWPISFLEDIQRYAPVAGGRNPLLVLADLAGWQNAGWFQYGVTAVLIVAMLIAWWRSLRHEDIALFELALYWTIVVSLLVTFQTGTTNQAILLIPFFAWLKRGSQEISAWTTAVIAGVAFFGLWALFLQTISGDYENPILFVPAPLLALLILIGTQLKQRQHETLAQTHS